jgi:hypothetical protein
VKILVVKLLTGVYIFGRFDEPMPGDLSRRLVALRLWAIMQKMAIAPVTGQRPIVR